uniref:uncharacterized protein LOC124059340 n=1 Tax=Scatophagus argus TaxID=75038 RepID=UPI001ED7D1BB|nr:uncharacterized protein LOC124059340 [Scatophagus argus]
MDRFISLLVLSMLPQFAVPQAASVTSFRAVAEMVSGHSKIFTGESVRLKCSVSDPHRSTWEYVWFTGSEQPLHTGEQLFLWKVRVKDSGKYYCRGVRDTVVGKIHTLQSLPVEITVDGGWAILQVPPHPSLVGDTLKVTCHLRGRAPLHEVILYKDGVEVMRQKGMNPHFYLTNLTTEDRGMYSCRASWDADARTRSVISTNTLVQVLEVLSQPVLEIEKDNDLIPAHSMKLICHHQYNAPAPAPPVHYYFYKNNKQLGTANSDNHVTVRRTPGLYSCRAKVPVLDLVRWSEPKSYGQVTGPQMLPPFLQSRGTRPVAPPISSSHWSLPHAPEPATARPSPHKSTVTAAFIQPTEVPQASGLRPSTLLSAVQSSSKIAITENVDIPEESVEMSGESGDMPKESDDVSHDSPVTVPVWQVSTHHRLVQK